MDTVDISTVSYYNTGENELKEQICLQCANLHTVQKCVRKISENIGKDDIGL